MAAIGVAGVVVVVALSDLMYVQPYSLDISRLRSNPHAAGAAGTAVGFVSSIDRPIAEMRRSSPDRQHV